MMQPLSPRPNDLPKRFHDINTSDNRKRAKMVRELAQSCADESNDEGFEACLREAYNAWLVLDYDPKAQLDGCEDALLQLASHKKANNDLAAALTLFERCSTLFEVRRKKLGGFGNPLALILHSEVLSARGKSEESGDMAKRAIDLLFRRYNHCHDLQEETTRDERILFGQAWLSLAVAEECQIPTSESDDERCARAVVALVHYRRGVKCCRDLLGSEDSVTVSMERRYAAAKKSLGKLAAAAPKDQMPPAVAAYPTDKSAPPMILDSNTDTRSPQPKPPPPMLGVGGQRTPSSLIRSPALSEQLPQRRSSAARIRSSSAMDNNPSPPKATSARQTVAAARLSQGIPAQINVPLQRKPTATRLEPLGNDYDFARQSRGSSASPKRPSIAQSSTVRSDHSSNASPRKGSTSVASEYDSESTSTMRTPRKLVPIGLSSQKRGLQMLFHAATAKKRSFFALRAVYMFTRDLHTSFPHFQLVLDRSLYDAIQTNEHRLDAMERGNGHTALEADVAQKIRQRRSIDEIRRKRADAEKIILYADMDKRTERNARRHKTMMAAVSAFMQNFDKTIIRNAYRKWLAFLGPRRALRPMRRAAAHLLKQGDRGLLRRRFVTWLRWLKERKRSVFVYTRSRSGVHNDGVKRAMQLISDQEAEDAATREKERRSKEEEEAYRIHREKLQAMQDEILENIASAESRAVLVPREDSPKIAVLDFLRREIVAFMEAVNHPPESEADASEWIEEHKHKLADNVEEYALSGDYEKEVRRLPCSMRDVAELTRIVSPFMVSVVLDEGLHSKFNIELGRTLLKRYHHWIDFHHIFFEDDVLLGAARAGDAEFVEALLDGIPNFVVSCLGTYITDLLEICVNHDSVSIQLLEVLLLKCEGVIPFYEVRDIASSILHTFFDRWIPSQARSFQRRGTLYDASNGFIMRSRVMTLFERAMLDVRSFALPHFKELPDKQTLLSRMCGGGDLELVELYTSLLEESETRNLVSRNQSDGTTCLIQAIRSRNSSLVRHLLDSYDFIAPQLFQVYDGQTVLQICSTRGCGEDMTKLLSEHGVEEPAASEHDHRPNSQSSRYSNVFGDSEDDIDRLFDPKESRRSSLGDLSFSSPHPPSEGASSFLRYGL